MTINFHKYEGTGNDFIIIDDRKKNFPAGDERVIRKMCDRKFGIGADGLILLRKHPSADFCMKFFNPDGRESTMCGNGGRCITLFGSELGIIGSKARFAAIDGIHECRILRRSATTAMVGLKMKDVGHINIQGKDLILNTGSPHYVTFVSDLKKLDITKQAHKVRYSKKFAKEGINVNFVKVENGKVHLRTYERGVEDETLSCGTGVVASALACSFIGYQGMSSSCKVTTPGGQLEVAFSKKGKSSFTNIWLTGPVSRVFQGEYTW